MTAQRTAFFVSDRTGITAEMLGHSLLAQFDGIAFIERPIPFVDTLEKAQRLLDEIRQARERDGARPLLFSTIVNPEINRFLQQADALVLDVMNMFITPMEQELAARSTHTVGRSHGARDPFGYHRRIEAVNFALSHDDGVSTRDLNKAEIVLVGVSRSGKTPTSLYMALQFGIWAANYPFTPDDFSAMRLPATLAVHKHKLYGLTINPDRLHRIRSERKPNSKYAELANCAFEVREAEALMRQEGIPYIDATAMSVEEMATTILHQANLKRHIF